MYTYNLFKYSNCCSASDNNKDTYYFLINPDEDEKLSEAQYVAYSESSLQDYQGQNKVIFFHAAWCTTCRALDAELSENISQLPEGTVVLKADYDSETDLRQKYGVNLQHTLVFIDDEGNQTKNNLIGANLDGLKAAL